MKHQSESAIQGYIIILGWAVVCLAVLTQPTAYAGSESINTSGNLFVERVSSTGIGNRRLNEERSGNFGASLALNQYVSPQDFAPGISNPGPNYVFRSLAGFAWPENEADTHRVYLGNANGDRFLARNLPYCDGSAFGTVFDCDINTVLHLHDGVQMNVQPLYKCFDAIAGDTYVSWFENCAQPGISGAPTGEGSYQYDAGQPDHLIGFTSCKGGIFWWITPYDPYDSDGDGIFGDCDVDDDNDGQPDTTDNCALDYNPLQENNDGDGRGDVCDFDDDNDGVPDTDDNCPLTPNADQMDFNHDGMGDACDDSDQDGVFDNVDNCPVHYNSDQADFNNNGLGDECENTDDDMFVDAHDNCILVPNSDQRDTNADGFGNICDADLNNDCVVNFLDWGILSSLFLSGDANADLNGDGIVNFVDFSIMVPLHLTEPGPSGLPNNCP